MGKKQTEILLRFRTDFEFYAPRALKIRTKSGQIIPFQMNRAQQYLHKRLTKQKKKKGWVRVICVKGRQQGISTYTEARFYWHVSGEFGKQAYILTHEEKATKNLFDMGKRYHDHCPEILRPHTKNKSAKELYFDVLDSGYAVGTARTEGTGRSGTIQYFHGSEVAQWRGAYEHMAGIGQALPLEPGTEAILESTAKGLDNMFAEMWQDATNDIGDYEPVFIPWYWQTEYQRPVPPDFVLDADEAEYMELYNLTLPQMVWRRNKILTDFRGNASKFAEEYPATPEEAFLAEIDGTLISPRVVQKAVKCTVAQAYGPRIMGVDPAEYGDDDTAFSYRHGRVMEDPETFHGLNQMQIAGLVNMRIQSKKIDKVCIDVSGGWGGGVAARLAELGHSGRIIRVNFGENAIDKEAYANRRAEMWADMADWFSDEEPCSIPDNKRLQAELSSPKYDYDSSRRLRLESKEQMKKRGIKSPDVADSAALTFAFKGMQASSNDNYGRRLPPNWRAL